MYGLVNAAIQELVCSKFGAEKWEQIRREAGVQVHSFSRMESYPDEVTYGLVGAASRVLDMPPDEVMKAFGEFWVLYTGKAGYGYLFDIAGSSLPDFLRNLDNLHSRVGLNFTRLRPPSFRVEDLGGNQLRLDYLSVRAGLCPMVIGLLRGLGTHFKTEISVEHPDPACARKGAQHCQFVITLQGSA